MLEIHDLCAGYAGVNVIHDVSLKAPSGQITAIIGPNGCGKSTLLKTVCGIIRASSGEILLDGEQLMSMPPNLLAQKVAYLSQHRQMPDITVERLVLHGRFPYLSYPRRYRKEDRLIARQAMEQMDLLELTEMPLNRLSGGQQQRAYIAMVLAQNTDVILLDEPTTYLDLSYQMQMLRLARKLADGGKHVIMVIHDLARALETADHIVLVADGKIKAQGAPGQIGQSSALEDVFQARIDRVAVNGTLRYFCSEK